MLLAGIVGREGKMKTASLISSFLVSTGKRVSVADSNSMVGFDFKRIRSYILELEKNKTDLLLLKLNEQDVEKLIENGLSFDIMIYTGKSEENDSPVNKKTFHPERILKLLNSRGISIINVDDNSLLLMLDGIEQHVVTYGFNSKASITTSSIGDSSIDGSFMCCLQRTIPAQNGKLVEPQEYKLKLEPGEFDSHNILAAASFAIVNGIDLNSLYCI